jgi:hypothetical protein
VRYLGSMWQGHISEHEWGCLCQIPPCESQAPAKIFDWLANLMGNTI